MINRYVILFFLVASLLQITAKELDQSFISSPEVKGPVKWQFAIDRTENKSHINIYFALSEGWHLYWKNPGEVGLPPSFRISVDGHEVALQNMIWPVPELDVSMDLKNYVYSDYLVLNASIDDIHDAREVRLEGEWLICKETCIPGYGELVINFQSPDTYKNKKILSQESVFPQSYDKLDFLVTYSDTGLIFDLSSIPSPIKSAYYFEEEKREKWVSQNFDIDAQKLLWMSSEQPGKGVMRIDFADGSVKAYDLDDDFWSEANIVASSAQMKGKSIYGLLLFALAGGFILNLMPCVFPVIGLKVFSFVSLAGEDKSKVKWYGIAYSFGIIASFLILAFGLFALRASGAQVGWGYQLQYPFFNVILAVVFMAFAMSLWGIFEVGYSMVGVDQKAGTAKNPYLSSFTSGILTTLAATPCSAPLLGPALGGAILLDRTTGILLFAVMGLGLSMPYLVLSFFPSLVKYLPKAGNWMIVFKQVLAFPLLGATLYLCWIIAGQIDEQSLLWLLLSLLLLAFSLWIYGLSKHGKGLQKTHVISFIFMSFSFLGIFKSLSSKESLWIDWSPIVQTKLLEERKNVWVDYTARWCSTCQVNKRLFDDAEIKDLFLEKKVVLLKADWTQRDPEITRSLETLGKTAIPVNILYSKEDPNGYQFPEILTKQHVLDRLNKLP